MKTKPSQPNKNKVFVTLPVGARRLFNILVNNKFYGSTSSEVARQLIIMKLDDLIEKGQLRDDGPEAPNLPSDGRPV
jgi:hypothetical protein